MYQNMYQNFSIPQRNEGTLIRVTGIEGARAYQMLPNSTVALFDGCDDIMYIKSTDGAGFPTIRTFRFEPVEQMPPSPTPVTREEFNLLRKELDDVKQLIRSAESESNGDRTGQTVNE